MGTRALAAGSWLVGGDDVDAQLALKRVLLAERHDVVAAELTDAPTARAVREAAALVASGRSVRGHLDPELPPLEAAALLVPEDLCVLLPADGRWCLAAGVVAFPSMWRLRDKLGLPLAAVHGPVPFYAEELAERVDRFLDRLRPDAAVWRRNWFVHACAELHLPEPPAALSRGGSAVPEGLWLRSERQTLRRLPDTGAVLFTIRTQQVPFTVLAERPEIAGSVAAAMRSWPPELVTYRGAASWRDEAVVWLKKAAGAAGGPGSSPPS